MAKSKKGRTKIAGERFTVFFTKGEVRNRVRLFPSSDGYRVSVTKRVGDKTTDRSVEPCISLEAARAHVKSLTDAALKAGWKQSLGVRANNAALFA